MKLARDTWLVFQRQLLLMWRTPIWIAVGVIQPIFYLLLFAPLLKQVLAPMGATTYAETYQIYVPGLLAVLCIFGGLYTGFSLLGELKAGIIERARVTPVSRLALLLGRALRETVALLVQAVIITLIALPFGLRVGPLNLLLAFLLMGLLALMTSAISYGIALVLPADEAMAPVVNTSPSRSRCSRGCCCRWRWRRCGCSRWPSGTPSTGLWRACARCSRAMSGTVRSGRGCWWSP